MTWCSQCFAVPAVAPAPERPRGWRPEAGSAAPAPTGHRTSRWHGGVTSFGPVGRVACTLAWVATVAMLVFAGSLFGLGLFLLVGPFWMREVWKPARTA